MNLIFVHLVQQKLLTLVVVFLAAFGLLLAIFPVMASQTLTTDVVSNTQTEKCYTQLASDPTATFTSTNAAAVQTAINMAPSGDIVKIAGTCRGISFTHGLSQTAYIDKSLTLHGGFTITNWITPDLSLLSILDADKAGRVVNISGGLTVTLANLQISNGDATNLGGALGGFDVGGGIRNAGADWVQIQNVNIYNNKGSLGAGLYNLTSVVITNSNINGNFGRTENSNYGGGIYNDSNGYIFISTTQFHGNTFANSYGSSAGAGIYNRGYISITTSTFNENNVSVPAGGNGGAINNNNGGHIIISQSTFSNNNAVFGSAIINFELITITNSTISQNSTTNGSGIDNGGILYSHNNSIINNSSTNPNRGGIANLYDGTETYLKNTIIGNNSPYDCEFSTYGISTSQGNNLDSDGTCIQAGQNSDITANNIQVANLADNGGKTFTQALLPGSPAINAGDCSDGSIIVDQRGVLRPQGNACDIGAFEIAAISGLTLTNDGPTDIFNSTVFTATIGSGDSPVYIWDFGDGETGNGANPTHTYSSDIGTYTAVVTVSNPINTITATTSVIITGYKIHLPIVISPPGNPNLTTEN